MQIFPLIDPYAIHYSSFAGDVYTLDTASITLTAGTLTADTLTDGFAVLTGNVLTVAQVTVAGGSVVLASTGISTLPDTDLNIGAGGAGIIKIGDDIDGVSTYDLLNFVDAEFEGDVSCNELTILTADTSGWKFSEAAQLAEMLCLQHLGTGTDARFGLFSNDGDTTDRIEFSVWAKGTPASIVDREFFQFRYNSSNARFEINTDKGGTSVDRDIAIYTRGNANQFVLDSAGNVGLYTVSPDTTLQVVGTAGFGDDAGNESLFEADGTLKFNGTATVWNDLVLPLDSAKVPASNAPSWESFVGNLNAFAYQVNDFQEFTAELLHGYKTGSDFEFHIHGALNALTAQEEKVQFEIEYSIADRDATDGFGDVFPDGSGSLLTAELTVPNATADLTNVFLTIGTDSSGSFGMGATIKGRIRRIAKSAGGNELTGNIFLTQVGIHYEIDTVGSRAITTK